MKDVKLVASDMDHTLLTEKNELPPTLFQDIDKLQSLGVEFAIASGRPVYTLEDIFGDLKSEMTFVSDNGGVIVYHGEVIHMSPLPTADYQKMTRFTLEQTTGVPVICGLDAAYVPSSAREYDAALRTFYTKIKFVDDIYAVDVKADKYTIYFPNGDSEVSNDDVFLPEFGNDYSVVISGPEWIDVMNKDIHKGTAMAILGDKLKIKPSEMMAFGDMYNDIEMLKYVKYSYLVANAAADMAQYANYRTDSNDDYGVTNVLEQLIEVKEP
ncbi:cof-like hydrolase family protein [Lapidilactobacillus dextrinicus DSM 20335]|uniref:Cof-like hydrolase family protein n=1 Tax=Lapidilactobacillus dextrinicus DSM 20335 TaxID=1423738 RepID=A0A0R2BT71_9LACO|nr:HAD family hydrolase [Lapidilactobacillus dextrinicus]KRM78675.1 cof-like hydrolase family protein [Lapidilactobacillus dextrinicus DSM 20335]QFG46605.1 Cof-type HAD-IIB family hydrolase [Lapidilactobacillus dextrinicus]